MKYFRVTSLLSNSLGVLAAVVLTAQQSSAENVITNGMAPVIERGTYVNYFSCQNPAYAVFAHFGDASGADSRLGQFLLGWNTAEAVPPNQPAVAYLIRHCRATITLNNGNQIIHDPTHDGLRTYFETNHVDWQADEDAGRPIELFGVDYRNGRSALTYLQCSAVGNGEPNSNHVFAVTWTTNGTARDIGNNVGKTTPEFAPFETWPFSVAQTTNAAPGELMPAGTKLTFDLNLDDPFVVAYIQRGLRDGKLHFMASSLHQVSGQFGTEPYPAFTTRFNQAVLDLPTTLDLEVTVVGPTDTDNDTLPDDWENFYFSSLTNSVAEDFDQDGVDNLAEFRAGTNPNDAASAFRLSIAKSGDATGLQWPNLPNRNFAVEYSEDLTTWRPATNSSLAFPTPQWTTWSDATNAPQRFYRVVNTQ